nr:DEAD/DEAH box helicase [Paracoccus sp. DMF]
MTKFSDLKLDPKVLKAIAEAGYETPTPIQAGAIPPALEGRDVLGIAQTGTGKTASFTLPMITLLGRGRARARMPRSLVLCPTRELAAQVAENFDIYAKHTRLTKALLIGGVSFGEQDRLIDRGVDVLIATPGRLLDHFERGKLLLTGVQIMVVDEADRMLDMGFIPDIERIFQLTPFTRQTLFFSATMAPEIERITDTFLHSPERIEVARQATTSETITQKLVEITPTRRDQSAKQKRELLRALIDAEGAGLKNAIIFCNRKTDVDIVAKSLKAHGYDAAPIHGDLDQRHRMATLDGFREGTLRFLVASDVAARGLDIPAVSHVINFDLPSHAEDYVHRIGRTGRAGREGTAISIGTPADEKYLTAIESLVKQSLPRAALPEGFTLSAAAQDAPRPGRESSGRRERGRERDRDRERGERRGRRDDSEQRAAAPEPRAEAPAQAERRHDRPAREERREDRRDDRRGERGGHDRHERRDDRRTDRHPVMGMGDHMPEFMTRTFRPGFLEPAEETPVVEAEDLAPALPETAAVTEAAPAPDTNAPAQAEKPKRSRSRKAKPAPEAAPALASEPAPATETPEPVAEASPEVAAEAVVEATTEAAAPEKPVRKRKPRVTKPKAETAQPEAASDAPDAAAAAEEPAEAAEKPARKPAKPRAPRKSRAKAQPDAPAETAPEAEAAAPQADTVPSPDDTAADA